MSVAGRTVAIMMETTSSNPERRREARRRQTPSLAPDLAAAGPPGPKLPLALRPRVVPNPKLHPPKRYSFQQANIRR